MDAEVILHIVLVVAGVGAGFLNTIAGGGSMLTLPVLMLLGLPADVANGTIRLSVVSQSVSGVWAFRRGGKLEQSAILPIIIPAVLGAVIGSVSASIVPPHILKYVLIGTMLVVATVMLVRPQLVAAPEGAESLLRKRRLAGFAGLFGAGLYGGFVQAGVGFVLLAVLGGVLRFDVVRANALKLMCTLMYGSVAVGVFAYAGQIAWVPALLLAVYTVVGSMLGVRFALRAKHTVIRWIIFAAVVATCVAALVKGA